MKRHDGDYILSATKFVQRLPAGLFLRTLMTFPVEERSNFRVVEVVW